MPVASARLFCFLSSLLLSPTLAIAFPGQLDASYGTNGMAYSQPLYSGVTGSSGGAAGMVRLADGKLVVAGSTSIHPESSKFALVRYLPDGAVDAAFGVEGRVNGGPVASQANGLLKDGSDRYLVFGQGIDQATGRAGFALARFLPDGTPDAAFGVDGAVTTAFDTFTSATARSARIDAQGRIVLAGERVGAFGTVRLFALARYQPDGALDATFGQGGTLAFGFDANMFDSAGGLAIDAAGRLVVVGSAGLGGLAAARLLASGDFDPSFGGTGKVLLGGVSIAGHAVEVDSNDRPVIAGSKLNLASGRPDMAVFRLTEAGSLDAGFGAGGIAPAVFEYSAGGARALFIDGAGRIVVAGDSGELSSTFAFARLLADGTLDTSFGSGGRQSIAFVAPHGYSQSSARAVVPGDAGRILFAGEARAFVVGELLEDGALDPAFNGGLVSVVRPAVIAETATGGRWQAIALSAGDTAFVAGFARTSGGDIGIVSRRTASGAADSTFAGTGVLALQVAFASTRFQAVAIDAFGRVVLAGWTAGADDVAQFAVARLLADGSRDPSFGAGGEVVIEFGTGRASGEARAVAIDGNGRIVVGGAHSQSLSRRFALARLLPDGTPDPAFGSGGKVLLDTGVAQAGINALALDGAGRIVAAGDAGFGGAPAVVRFTSAGVPDASFGAGGIVDLGGAGRLNGARSLAIDAGGRILVGGWGAGPGNPLMAMAFARLDAAGVPDPAFGSGGFVVADFAATGVAANAIAIDPAGRVLAAGSVGTQLRLVRLNPDGSADANFGGFGFTNTAAGGAFVEAGALGLLPDGKALVAGATGSANGAFIARFVTEQAPGTNLLAVRLSGLGVVTSNPGGISCESRCLADFPSGTTITLQATAGTNHRFVGWAGACSGEGDCALTMDTTRPVFALFASNLVGGAFANLSARIQVQEGENALIGGFVVGGDGPRTVVVRARGPSLAPFGVTAPLRNPRIDLFAGPVPVMGNDQWASGQDASELIAAGLAPSDPNEAAVRAILQPGAYTVVVSGVNEPPGTPPTGTGIVEIFNPDPANRALYNIAARGRVLPGDDVMIAGFVIQGTQPQSVVIRARGPSLEASGIASPLADPQLQVFAGQVEIARNDDWASGGTSTQVRTLGFEPADSRESALYLTLAPGAYTAIVSGRSGATGVAIVEVFAVDTLP